MKILIYTFAFMVLFTVRLTAQEPVLKLPLVASSGAADEVEDEANRVKP